MSAPLSPLDGAPGPAPARSRRALAAMRDRIVARAALSNRVGRGMSWPLQLAAAVALGLACAGTGLAAVRTWPALRAYFAPAETAVPADPPPPPPPPPSERPRPSTAQPPLDAVADPSPAAADEPSEASEPKEPRARAAAEARVPADWLARANQLRAQQRWRAAEALYLHGLESATSGAARSAAAVAAADLRLNHLHQPRAALASFERALALEPHGALSAQARHGIALSYRALGDRTREAAALREFIAAHPSSPMRRRAEQRVEELARE